MSAFLANVSVVSFWNIISLQIRLKKLAVERNILTVEHFGSCACQLMNITITVFNDVGDAVLLRRLCRSVSCSR